MQVKTTNAKQDLEYLFQYLNYFVPICMYKDSARMSI